MKLLAAFISIVFASGIASAANELPSLSILKSAKAVVVKPNSIEIKPGYGNSIDFQIGSTLYNRRYNSNISSVEISKDVAMITKLVNEAKTQGTLLVVDTDIFYYTVSSTAQFVTESNKNDVLYVTAIPTEAVARDGYINSDFLSQSNRNQQIAEMIAITKFESDKESAYFEAVTKASAAELKENQKIQAEQKRKAAQRMALMLDLRKESQGR